MRGKSQNQSTPTRVRQGCGLSPEWKQTARNDIQLASGKRIDTILNAND